MSDGQGYEGDKPIDGAWAAATPEDAEKLLANAGRLVGLIRKHPEVLNNLAAGYQAVREGFSQFLTANDRGADRVQATADKLIDSIDRDLEREGLGPDERNRLIEAEQQVLRDVIGNESEVRQANERSFAKIATIGVTVAVGIVVVGVLASQGKLPEVDSGPSV